MFFYNPKDFLVIFQDQLHPLQPIFSDKLSSLQSINEFESLPRLLRLNFVERKGKSSLLGFVEGSNLKDAIKNEFITQKEVSDAQVSYLDSLVGKALSFVKTKKLETDSYYSEETVKVLRHGIKRNLFFPRDKKFIESELKKYYSGQKSDSDKIQKHREHIKPNFEGLNYNLFGTYD